MRPAPPLFTGRQTLILSMPEVKQVLSVAEAIALQRLAFEAHAQGKAWNAPNTWLPVSAHHGWLKLLAGWVEHPPALGVKVVARYPQHPPGQNLGGLCILFDPTCGFPVAIVESVYLTGVRTGAGGGLATQWFRVSSQGLFLDRYVHGRRVGTADIQEAKALLDELA